MRSIVMIGVLAVGCSAPAPSHPSPPKDPDWLVAARSNDQLGLEAYNARVAAAPKRAPGERIFVGNMVDVTNDSFERLHHEANIAVRNVAHSFGRLELRRGPSPGPTPWYEALTTAAEVYDVVLYLRIEGQSPEVSAAHCPPNHQYFTISAKWSSAYVRVDHVQNGELCTHETAKHAAVFDHDGAVRPIELVMRAVETEIDTVTRQELPALSEAIALTPGYRKDVKPAPRQRGGGGSLFDLLIKN